MINLSLLQLELNSLNKVQTEATGKCLQRKVCMSFVIVIGDVSMSGVLSSIKTFSSGWKFGSVCLLSFLCWRWYKETESTTTYFNRRCNQATCSSSLVTTRKQETYRLNPGFEAFLPKNYTQLRRLFNLQNVYLSDFYRVFFFMWCGLHGVVPLNQMTTRLDVVEPKLKQKRAVEFLFFNWALKEALWVRPKRNQNSFIKSMTAALRGTTRRCPLIKDVGGNDSSSLSAWQRRISADKMPDHKLCLL